MNCMLCVRTFYSDLGLARVKLRAKVWVRVGLGLELVIGLALRYIKYAQHVYCMRSDFFY